MRATWGEWHHVQRLEENVYAPGREWTALASASRRKNQSTETACCRPLTRLEHAIGGPAKKKSRAHTPSTSSHLVSRYHSGQLHTGLSASPVQSRRLLSTKPSKESVRFADAHSRSGPCAHAIWVSVHLGAPALRRRASESEKRLKSL